VNFVEVIGIKKNKKHEKDYLTSTYHPTDGGV
jgi:hypothetical protein